jgi:hypothetical protein
MTRPSDSRLLDIGMFADSMMSTSMFPVLILFSAQHLFNHLTRHTMTRDLNTGQLGPGFELGHCTWPGSRSPRLPQKTP